MASSALLQVLLIFTVFCGVHSGLPCETAGCGLDNCFHKYDADSDELVALCKPMHGLQQELDDRYKKVCPPLKFIGTNGDRTDCGPNNHVIRCDEDSDCNMLTEMCCFDGCKTRCKKFWLSSQP